jgi:hypothetical protein
LSGHSQETKLASALEQKGFNIKHCSLDAHLLTVQGKETPEGPGRQPVEGPVTLVLRDRRGWILREPSKERRIQASRRTLATCSIALWGREEAGSVSAEGTTVRGNSGVAWDEPMWGEALLGWCPQKEQEDKKPGKKTGENELPLPPRARTCLTSSCTERSKTGTVGEPHLCVTGSQEGHRRVAWSLEKITAFHNADPSNVWICRLAASRPRQENSVTVGFLCQHILIEIVLGVQRIGLHLPRTKSLLVLQKFQEL